MSRGRWAPAALVLAIAALVAASFWSLDLHLLPLLAPSSRAAMARFAGEFYPPDLSALFVSKVLRAAVETLAMSALGTVLATVAALLLCIPAAGRGGARIAAWQGPTRLLLNLLRSIPELVWASLLLVAAGLGPMTGTLALGVHTAGVLGRLFAEAVDNAPPGPAEALRAQGTGEALVLLYATLPQVAPQLLSYVLYRWDNNIRAAAVLGVVGAGGLGQLLAFHLGLFQMARAATVIGATVLLVLLVDLASHAARRALARGGLGAA